ncbi:MAG: hypothetical protein KDC44_24095, partial [Phaeodactylibacter sp.]|nr:hypothetical protein [Phaeodactylibacter sp.]
SWQVCKGWSLRAGGHFDFALTRKSLFFSNTNSGLDFAGVAGTGFHIGERIEIELRYLHGLIDLYRWEVIDFEGRIEGKRAWRNRSLQLSVGLIFKK